MINYYAFPGIIHETVGVMVRPKEEIDLLDEQKLEQLFCVIEEITGISKLQIMSSSRKSNIREARQIFHYIGRNLTQMSLQAIGILTLNDHATVNHSFKTVLKDMETNYKIANLVRKIEYRINKEINKSKT